MNNLPWSKFYWGDWARDAGLRACSYAAKGLWMDMLCQMDASRERGFLIVGNRAATPHEIARIVGGERRTVERLLRELEANGVFSRDDRSVIFSRRMTRECDISRRNIANGKLGGNPILIKTNSLDKNPVNQPDKAEAEADTEADKKTPPLPPQKPINGQQSLLPATPSADPKGRRLDPTWNPGDAGHEYATKLGLNPAMTFTRFRNYWLSLAGAKARKVDWLKVWQNWCLKEAEDRGTAPPPPVTGPRKPTPTYGGVY